MVYVEHVHCSSCGKRVSGVDPEMGLVVRAYVQCPECIERDDKDAELFRTALQDCLVVLRNMALENRESLNPFKTRWPIHHEPLRADARALVPRIEALLKKPE